MDNILVARSKAWICEGLINEMKVKSYDDISIKEIASSSGVSTRTIYRHFKSKDMILYTATENMLYSYKDNMEHGRDLDLTSQLKSLCGFFEKEKEFLHLLLSAGKFNMFRKAFSMLPVLGSNIFNPRDKEHAYQNIYYIEYYKKFIVSIMSDLIEIWIKNGFKETTEELSEIAIHFISSVSKATAK